MTLLIAWALQQHRQTSHSCICSAVTTECVQLHVACCTSHAAAAVAALVSGTGHYLGIVAAWTDIRLLPIPS